MDDSFDMSSKQKKPKKENRIEYLPVDKDPEFNADLKPSTIISKEEILDLIIDKDEWPELDSQESDENIDD